MNVQKKEPMTFNDPDFDPKSWINMTWSSEGHPNKEVFVANTVSKMQLYMKQLTNAIDETTTQIVTSMPRLVNDAARLHDEGWLLQQLLLSLEEKVHGVEEQTGQSIESLQRIDKLKSKLESAASALQEADKWAALTSSLENVLETGVPTTSEKLSELATQVTAMTQSLEVLSETSDYDEKRVQLETLYNRLEAAISPPLIDAITQMDADRTSIYTGLFAGMGRRGAARACWRRAAATRLAAAWRRLDNHSLPALTRLISTHASSQISWLTGVLQSEQPISQLLILYTDLLKSLDPSPTKLVSANLKLVASPKDGLEMLKEVRRDVEELVSTIQGIVKTRTQETYRLQEKNDFIWMASASLREVLPKSSDLLTQVLLSYINGQPAYVDDFVKYAKYILGKVVDSEDHLDMASSTLKNIAGNTYYLFYRPSVENYISSLTNLIADHQRRIEADFLLAVAATKSTGVLSETFAASLVLETAATTLLDSFQRRYQAELDTMASEKLETEDSSEDFALRLLNADGWKKLDALRNEPPSCTRALRRVRDQLLKQARNILKEPVETQLDKIPSLSAWTNNDALSTDLPDFALSPQEYITEIGQYLMTLPQHLEMHMMEKQQPWQFLAEVCSQTCDLYAQKIISIKNMDELGTRRCLTDIAYLSSVLEDLGSSITPSLKNLEESLRMAAPDFRAPADNDSVPAEG